MRIVADGHGLDIDHPCGIVGMKGCGTLYCTVLYCNDRAAHDFTVTAVLYRNDCTVTSVLYCNDCTDE
jgi:hypothetical protein